MVKLLGSLLILSGSGLLWVQRMAAWRRRRNVLRDLLAVLRAMGDEIRMIRTPMPQLLRRMADRCGEEARVVLFLTADAAERGEPLSASWNSGIMALPLGSKEQEILLELGLQGDEETLCKEISLAADRLARRLDELEQTRPEEVKRTSALCFSGGALLVILLI